MAIAAYHAFSATHFAYRSIYYCMLIFASERKMSILWGPYRPFKPWQGFWVSLPSMRHEERRKEGLFEKRRRNKKCAKRMRFQGDRHIPKPQKMRPVCCRPSMANHVRHKGLVKRPLGTTLL